jgi:hypothetical protein
MKQNAGCAAVRFMAGRLCNQDGAMEKQGKAGVLLHGDPEVKPQRSEGFYFRVPSAERRLRRRSLHGRPALQSGWGHGETRKSRRSASWRP